jgi:hypothetical protein
VKDINSNAMGWVLIVLSPMMFLGAILAWAWLPEVQSPTRVANGRKLVNKSLETLALGRTEAEQGGQVVGMRRRLRGLVSFRT